MARRFRIVFSCVLTWVMTFVFCMPPAVSWGKRHVEGVSLGAHLTEMYKDDLDGLIKRRRVRVLTTYNMTNYFICGGRLYGYEYSLLREYEKFLNKGKKRMELPVMLEFIPVSRDQLIPMLKGGYGDIAAAGLTITPGRAREVDFTDPYLTGVSEILVTNKRVRDLRSLDDLSGRAVVVRKSSSYYESLLSLNTLFRRRSMEGIRIVRADESLRTEELLEMVNSGAVEITVSDSHIARLWAEYLKNIKILENLEIRRGSKIAWLVRKNNPELKTSLNRFISTHRKGTLWGNIYFNQYYKNNQWIENPLCEEEAVKLSRYVDLFKKYGSQYGIDWMLIAAMAYQESGLDQKKRNPSGAVGLMQVRPSTAADKNIGIRNVENADNNVHAGVKYLDFLRKRYYSDPEISKRNRIRFALAAYNAGPAKIRKARKLAREKGLDPNRWFDNVEIAALESIGREPVQYVNNINKYYVAYQFGMRNKRSNKE